MPSCYLLKKLISDIYQNCGVEYSAPILPVAPRNPIPAAPHRRYPHPPCPAGSFVLITRKPPCLPVAIVINAGHRIK